MQPLGRAPALQRPPQGRCQIDDLPQHRHPIRRPHALAQRQHEQSRTMVSAAIGVSDRVVRLFLGSGFSAQYHGTLAMGATLMRARLLTLLCLRSTIDPYHLRTARGAGLFLVLQTRRAVLDQSRAAQCLSRSFAAHSMRDRRQERQRVELFIAEEYKLNRAASVRPRNSWPETLCGPAHRLCAGAQLACPFAALSREAIGPALDSPR